MFGIPLHLFIVHFPIALIWIAVAYDARAIFSTQPRLHRVGYGLTGWAAGGAVLAVASGFQLGGGSAATIHAAAGMIGAVSLVALAMLRYSAVAKDAEAIEAYPMLWFALQLVAASAITAAAISGHRLANGFN